MLLVLAAGAVALMVVAAVGWSMSAKVAEIRPFVHAGE